MEKDENIDIDKKDPQLNEHASEKEEKNYKIIDRHK